MESETIEILSGDKVPLRDNKGATSGKLYLRHDLAQFNVSSFLDLHTHMLIHLEIFTKIIHQLSRDLHTTQALSLYYSSHPGIFDPDHTKLLDHLSEPSSQLIHHISHPLEEDVLDEVVNSHFTCIQVHGFASCIPTFCKRDLSVTTTSKQPSWK